MFIQLLRSLREGKFPQYTHTQIFTIPVASPSKLNRVCTTWNLSLVAIEVMFGGGRAQTSTVRKFALRRATLLSSCPDGCYILVFSDGTLSVGRNKMHVPEATCTKVVLLV